MIKRFYNIVKKYFSLNINSKSRITVFFISALTKDLIVLMFPILFARIVEFTIDKNFEEVFLNLIFLGISYFVRVMLNHWNFVEYAKMKNEAYNKLQNKIVDKVSNYREDYSKKISKHFIMNTIRGDVSYVAFLLGFISDAIARFINLIISIIIIINYNVYIGIIALIFNLIYLYYINKLTKKRDIYRKGQRERQDRIVGFYSQLLDGNKEIKSYNMQEGLNKYFDRKLDDWKEQYTLKRKYYDKKEALVPLITVLGRIILYLIVINSIFTNGETIGMLILVIGYYERLELDSNSLNTILDEVFGNSVKLDRVCDVLNYENNNEAEFGNINKTDISGIIGFEKVSLSYEEEKVLKDINFNIGTNKLTTIVGESGSGKSSIFKLLLRLKKLDKGKIYIDDTDIYEFSKEVYSNIVSVVVQEPFIFNMSIKQNLSLINNNFDDILKVCKKVGIHNHIMRLSRGYDTVLKENGTNLSGGQKKLLAIARMLLTKSKILLFDEVTSALDVDTEKHVMKLLKEISKTHTVIMITHKPELMKESDDILVMKKGKLVDRGSYEYLIENNYYFKEL